MKHVAQGDPDALQPLFERWKLPLMTYFYRSLGCRADAEDLTLRTFERVFKAASRYRPEARFSTWLFSIARHEQLHEIRRRRRKPLEPLPPDELVLIQTDQSSLELRRSVELEEQLLHSLQQLPERERSAILLAASGNLNQTEAAEALNVSKNHFNVILHRARQRLRATFHGKTHQGHDHE